MTGDQQRTDEVADEGYGPSNDFSRHLGDALDFVEDLATGRRSMPGLPTGFHGLDGLTGGMQPGTLTVLASRPGMGRTTLAADFVRATAIAGGLPVFVCTLEETTLEYATRIMCAEARVARDRLRSGSLTDEDWTRLARRMPAVGDASLHVDAPPSAGPADVELAAAEAVEEYGVRLVVVDGLNSLTPARRADTREREVGDNARALKTLARRLGVPVVATAHLARPRRADHRPALEDLRESGAVEAEADVVILLHREDHYDPGSHRAGESDLCVVKNRQGPTGTAVVVFQPHYGRHADFVPFPDGETTHRTTKEHDDPAQVARMDHP